MATRTISFDFRQPDASGVDQPTGGLVTIRPWPDRMRPTDGHYYVVAEPVTLQLVDGQVTVPLEVTGGTWCWRIDGPTEVRFITVPAGAGTLPFTDCPDVDPATLEVTAQPESAWWVALEALADLVGEGGGGGGGGTPADGSVTNAKVAAGAGITLDKTADSAAGGGRLAMTTAERAKLASGVATAAQGAKADTAAQPADVTAAINSLVASAPGVLDTLAELATALGNDPAFATTITTLLAARVRVDTAAQGLTGTQQTNARTNIAAADDSAVVKLAGAQTVAGVKTFSSSPAVPDASFAIAKVSGLQTALDAKLPATPATDIGNDYSMTYTAAASLGSRPSLPTGAKLRIYGGTTSDADPSWMATGDYRDLETA